MRIKKKNCEVQKENNNNKLKIMEKFAWNFPQIDSILSSSIGSGLGGGKTIEKVSDQIGINNGVTLVSFCGYGRWELDDYRFNLEWNEAAASAFKLRALCIEWETHHTDGNLCPGGNQRRIFRGKIEIPFIP